MQDQEKSLRLRGEKKVVALNSLTSFPRGDVFLHKLISINLYTSPEMLQITK